MRHVVLSGAIATGPRRMVHPTAAAGLVAPPGRALGVAPRRLCTTLCAVNLAAIAVAADQHLSLAAHAQKQPGQSSSPRATAHMDAIGNDWNTAPACVLSTVWGTASIRDLAVEVGAVPASPIRQVLTSRQAGCAGRNPPRAQACGFVDNARGVAHKPTGPTAAADNLNNLEISSVRTTPGSPSQAALKATRHGCYDLFRRLYAGPDSRSHGSTSVPVIASSHEKNEVTTSPRNKRYLRAMRRLCSDGGIVSCGTRNHRAASFVSSWRAPNGQSQPQNTARPQRNSPTSVNADRIATSGWPGNSPSESRQRDCECRSAG